MKSVFEIPWYCLTYEQAAVDLGFREEFLREALQTLNHIAPLPKKSLAIDLGCATGTSTVILLEEVLNVREVAAFDQEGSMLELARYKFGHSPHGNIERVLHSGSHYPPIVTEHARIRNLDAHLHHVQKQTSRYSHKAHFIQYRAEDILTGLHEDRVNLVLADRTLRWPRRLGIHPGGNPNLYYEGRVMASINHWTKPEGNLVFTMGGEDVLFANRQWDESHFTRHPFYLAFMEGLRLKLGSFLPEENQLDFREEDVYALAAQHGFFILRQGGMVMDLDPARLYELCFVDGYTNVFMKYGIDTDPDVMSDVLERALAYAQERARPEDAPVRETGLYVIARKERNVE